MSPIVASCLKKKAYTEAEAEAVVDASDERGLAAYKCPLGNHYHVGHRRSQSAHKRSNKRKRK
jgi:hypothetical protein